MNIIQSKPIFTGTLVNNMTIDQIYDALEGHYDLVPLHSTQPVDTLDFNQAAIRQTDNGQEVAGKDIIEDRKIYKLLKQVDDRVEYVDDAPIETRFLGDDIPETKPTKKQPPKTIDFFA